MRGMSTKKKPLPPPWGIQTFLNEPHHEDKGWLKGTIMYPTWGTAGRPDITLYVADCDRKITLDFGPDEAASIDDRIAKVERLRDTVNEFSRAAIKALRASRPKPQANEDHAKN